MSIYEGVCVMSIILALVALFARYVDLGDGER